MRVNNKTFGLNLAVWFSLFGFWRWVFVNHLLQREQLQLFITDARYFLNHVVRPGGAVLYLDSFVLSFFRFPWLAAGLMATMLIGLALALQKLFSQIDRRSVYVALSFVPTLFYQLLLYDSYYHVAGLMALLLACWALVAAVAFDGLSRVRGRVLLAACLYWLTGAAVWSFVLGLMALDYGMCKQIDVSQCKKMIVRHSLLWLAMLAIPLIYYFLGPPDNLQELICSRAYYKISLLFPFPLVLVLLSPVLLLLVVWVIHVFQRTRFTLVIEVFSSVLVLVFGIWTLVYAPDFDEEQDLKFENLAARQQWEAIVSEAEKNPPVGIGAKVALSTALAQTGTMTDLLFRFNLRKEDFFVAYRLQGMAPVVASDPVFFMGLNNFAQMLASEAMNSSPDERMPVRAVQRYVEACLVNGQYAVAQRYLYYLSHSLFYRRWAHTMESMLQRDDRVEEHPLYGRLRSYLPADSFYLDYEQINRAFVSLLRQNPKNKAACEYLLCWCLLEKDFDAFLKYLPLLLRAGYSEVPHSVQEALLYVKSLFEEVPEGLQQIPISQEVRKEFAAYAAAFRNGGSNDAVGMKKRFGKTYWYYVHFEGD